MTLATIANAVADEIGIPRPSSVVGNSDADVQKILRHANRAGWRLMKRVPWQALRKEQTFSSVAAEEQTGILPSDFDRFIPETFWNRNDTILISGPVHAVEWQGKKANQYGDTTEPKFIYRGDSVYIIPTPQGGKTFAFEYISQHWCESSGGTGQTAWADDTDVGVIDEELMIAAVKYMYLTSEGLPNGEAAADFNMYLDTLLDNDQPDSGVMVAADIFGGGRHFTGQPPVDGEASIL